MIYYALQFWLDCSGYTKGGVRLKKMEGSALPEDRHDNNKPVMRGNRYYAEYADAKTELLSTHQNFQKTRAHARIEFHDEVMGEYFIYEG